MYDHESVVCEHMPPRLQQQGTRLLSGTKEDEEQAEEEKEFKN